LVANGVRETLGALLGSVVSVRLLEPILPDPAGWAAIGKDAHIFAVRGPLADAAFILRAADAAAFVRAAFGEMAPQPHALSPLEGQVLRRALRAISGCLSPICGARDAAPCEASDARSFTTYFELLLDRPASLRLGVALSREPEAKSAPALTLADLHGVEIDLAVECATGLLEAGRLLELQPGETVKLSTRIDGPGALTAAGRVFLRGECGQAGERRAFVVL